MDVPLGFKSSSTHGMHIRESIVLIETIFQSVVCMQDYQYRQAQSDHTLFIKQSLQVKATTHIVYGDKKDFIE